MKASNAGIKEVVAGDLVYNADDSNNSARAVPKIRESDTLPTNTGVGIGDVVQDEIIDVDVATEGPCRVKVCWNLYNGEIQMMFGCRCTLTVAFSHCSV